MERVAVRSETTVGVSQTELLDTTDAAESPPVLRLRLRKPKNDRKVGWREGTVDNEHMNKKKSKCCCIYKKPHAFGESSSEDDEECEHCFGHPEKRRRNMKKRAHDHDHDDHSHDDGGSSNDGDGPSCSWKPKDTATETVPPNEAPTPSAPDTEPIPTPPPPTTDEDPSSPPANSLGNQS